MYRSFCIIACVQVSLPTKLVILVVSDEHSFITPRKDEEVDNKSNVLSEKKFV